jgi:hypothetical protein
VYAKGLGVLGELLGYSVTFPTYGAATDCRWRGVFGNSRELFTFECKIEHQPAAEIDAHAVGQAHNQYSRAVTEFGSAGYAVRGLIVTHLERLTADAAPGLGEMVVLRRDAVEAVRRRADELIARFAAEWSLNDPHARVMAADNLARALPPTGWFRDAIDNTDRFLDAEQLLAAWP